MSGSNLMYESSENKVKCLCMMISIMLWEKMNYSYYLYLITVVLCMR